MKIIIPAIPSDYARPYPELVLKGTAEQMQDVVNVLSGLDRSDPRGICCRIQEAVLQKAIMSALDGYVFITGYLDAYRSGDLDEETKSISAAIRAKWIDHIEHSLWEQLGKCQT